uniref:Uncharacterized protein n=1 Tax=Timema shepardi TaxID=629360 RepID=A0A7R9FWY6_TIMSH|nr:unnamed protein product [Timema shepardi]
MASLVLSDSSQLTSDSQHLGEKGLDLSELWRSRTSAHGPTGLSAPSTFRRWRRGGSARTSAPTKTAIPAQDARGLGGAEEDRSLLKFLALKEREKLNVCYHALQHFNPIIISRSTRATAIISDVWGCAEAGNGTLARVRIINSRHASRALKDARERGGPTMRR